MYFKNIIRFVILLYFLELFLYFPLFAEVPDFAEQEQRRLQQQQQQIIDEQLRRQELNKAETTRPRVFSSTTAQTQKNTISESKRCVEIKTIKFYGNTILSNKNIHKILVVYEGRCLSVDEINTMLNDITNIYLDKGYSTSRAFIIMPQTKLKEGILEVRIFEGYIHKIKGLNVGKRITAFPFLENKILNLRDIEQGLDQINRLNSNKASMNIMASEVRKGYSDIIVKNEPLGRTNIGFTFDNLGSKSTGENRASLRLTEDDIFGLNDQINLSYTNSLVFDRKNRDSKSVLFSFSMPFGWWTFNNNFSYSYYKTSFPMPVSGDRFYSYGDSYNENFSIEYMLSRGQIYKLATNMGLVYKDSKNYMKVYDLKIKNESSSCALSVLNIDLPLTIYFRRGMFYIKPTWLHGVKMFSSFDDSDSQYSQKAQYDAYKLYLFSNWNFDYISFMTAIDTQYSSDELFSTEIFYLGGESSIRGFRNEGIQGDSGFYIKNDIAFNLGKIFNSQNKWLNIFTPSLFIDYGKVFPNTKTADSSSLAGAGIKLALKYWLFDASVTYSKVLRKDDWMTEKSSIYVFIGINGRF